MSVISVKVQGQDAVQLANTIRKAMTEKSIGVSTLAQLSSMSESTIITYLNNTRTQPNISLYSLVGIADALQLDPMNLLCIAEGRQTAITQQQIDNARNVVMARVAKAARQANVSVSQAPPSPPQDDVPAQVESDTVTISANEVPSSVDIMLLVRKLTEAEDRVLAYEIIQAILDERKGNHGN